MSRQFLDRLRIFVTAGSGAAGNPAIRGKGGNGGSVYLEVKDDYSLSRLLRENPSKRFKVSTNRGFHLDLLRYCLTDHYSRYRSFATFRHFPYS